MELKREFVLREIAGDALLVPTGKTSLELNGMVTLNPVGAYIWQLLPQVDSPGEIVERILEEYDAEPEEVAQDVEAFLEQLRSLGIL